MDRGRLAVARCMVDEHRLPCASLLGSTWNRGWDDAVQGAAEASDEEPWHNAARDRERWARLEGASFNRSLRDTATHAVPRMRHMLAESTQTGHDA